MSLSSSYSSSTRRGMTYFLCALLLAAALLSLNTREIATDNELSFLSQLDKEEESDEFGDGYRTESVVENELIHSVDGIDNYPMEEEQLLNQKGVIHITHFFSTFTAPKTSTAYYEQKIVQESWERAAVRALQVSGLKVEFIDMTMPGDTGSAPNFAKHEDLKWWLHDVKKGKVPTVGEPFLVAQKKGRGQIMIFTNADIGVMPDFYERVWAWSTKDYRTPSAQMDVMKETARYIAACYYQLNVFQGQIPLNHFDICVEDSRVYYIHAGGFEQLWREEKIRLQMAIMATKLQRAIGPLEATQRRFVNLLQSLVPNLADQVLRDAASNWRAYVLKFRPSAPSSEVLSRIPKPLFAGTITRIDIDYAVNSSNWDGAENMFPRMLRLLPTLGAIHPGNDCFVFHRDHLPHVVSHMGHPAGVRPFGQWLAVAWWNSDHPYRRITATIQNPWTFHVGIGLWGLDTIPWKERANENPSYTLFLAANFDRLGKGIFKKMFDGPTVCQNSTIPWRSPKFCYGLSNEFCAGVARFSCYYHYNILLRDALWYQEACQAIYQTNGGILKKPACDICNFLFQMRHPEAMRTFMCEDGRMEYCKGLGDEVC